MQGHFKGAVQSHNIIVTRKLIKNTAEKDGTRMNVWKWPVTKSVERHSSSLAKKRKKNS